MLSRLRINSVNNLVRAVITMLKNRILLIIAFIIILGGIFLVKWGNLFPPENVIEVKFDNQESRSDTSVSGEILFAVAPVLSPEKSIQDYQLLARYLSSKLALPVRIIQRKTYGELNELLRHNAIDLAIICTGAFIDAQMNEIPLEVIAVPVYEEGAVYHSLLIVRSDSKFQYVQDLKRTVFAFTDPLSLSGHYYPSYFFLEKNLEPRVFFSKILFTYSHAGSIQAVLDGIVDAAAVDNLVYEFEVQKRPEIKDKLRIIHSSPALGVNPVVAPAAKDSSLRNNIKRILISMDESEDGARILTNLGILKFEIPAPDLYNGARQIFARVREYAEEPKVR